MTREFVVDGIFYQIGKSGIARVWNKLLEEWVRSGFAERVAVIDRQRTAQRVDGVLYLDAPAFFHERTAEDRHMLQAICDQQGSRAFISTYYSIPETTPSLMMVHDMIPEVLGWDMSQPMWQQKQDALRYASAFVTVSTNTALDVRRLIDRPERDITVALNGCDFTPPPAEQVEAFKARCGIDRPYFMLSGSRSDYKNAILFFKAFERLGADRSRYAVLCTGGGTLEPEMAACLGEGKAFIGILSDDDLRCAYAGAQALVYPSLYEGFGLPVLEAMACGAPVISSRVASLPEVGGDAPLYIDVTGQDPAAAALALADQLRTVTDPVVRETMVRKGQAQAATFTWSGMAAVVQDCLQRLAPPQAGVKLSVITTCLNQAGPLAQAIDSVREKADVEVEHIVIDRGSDDETASVLAAHPQLVVRRVPGLSELEALQLGLSLASGALIGQLGTHDRYLAGALAAVSQAGAQGATVVMGNVRIHHAARGVDFVNVPRHTLEGMLRHWEPNAFCHQPLGYFCAPAVWRDCPLNAANAVAMNLEFLLDVAAKFPISKIDATLGVSEQTTGNGDGNGNGDEAQVSPVWWRVSTFPFIERHLATLPLAEQEGYRSARRQAYMALQAENNRRALAKGRRPDATGLTETVTVVIPTYDDAATLERAIASALTQTYPHVHVLVVDDAGPAQGKAWVDERYAGEGRVSAVRHERNKMLGGARNTGISLAQGDHIFFLDADDELLPDAIAKLVAIAHHGEADIVQGGTLKVDASGQEVIFHQADFCSDGGVEGVEFFALHRHASVAWNKLYRRAFLQAHAHLRFLEAYMHEDVTFALRTAYQARSVASVTDPVIKYHTNEQSLTHRKPGRINLLSYLAVYQDLMKALASFQLPDESSRPGLTRRVVRAHVTGDFIPKLMQCRQKLGADEFGALLHDVGYSQLGPDGVALANLIDVLLGVVAQPRG